MAVADLDGDHALDMVTANYGSNTISVLMGTGSGTFQPKIDVPAGVARPLALTSSDLNGDGHPDIVVVNGRSTDRVAVLLGDGTGGFETSTYPGGHAAQAVIAADVNGDGDPDIATANGVGGVSVLLGDGSGALEAAVDYPTRSSMCSGLAAADLDGDGNLDLVTANSFLGQGASNHSVSVLMGRGDGTFGPPLRYRHVGTQPTMVAIADLNGDGDLDLVTPNGGWPTHDASIMFGAGDGTFAAPVHVPMGPSPHTIAAVDLDGDGVVDLAATNLGTYYGIPLRHQGITIRLGKGDGTFGRKSTLKSTFPTSLTAADLNGDGAIDLAVANELASIVSVFLNRS